MTNRDRVLEFLRRVGPAGATNQEIVSRTGIKPHPQVFMITQELLRQGRIKGVLSGKEWRFWLVDRQESASPPKTAATLGPPARANKPQAGLTPAEFESVALAAMSKEFGVPLRPGRVPGVPKLFDCVSPDGQM
jgi:hypothetical protein